MTTEEPDLEVEVLDVQLPPSNYVVIVETFGPCPGETKNPYKTWTEAGRYQDTPDGIERAKSTSTEMALAGIPARVIRKLDLDKVALVAEADERRNGASGGRPNA